MRPRNLLILFVLVVGLGAFVWFYERDLPSSEQRVENARKLLQGAAAEIEDVVIERGATRVRLVREPTSEAADSTAAQPRWRLAEPLSAPADDTAVESLLEGLYSLDVERRLDDAQPAAVGLAPPRASVVLSGGGRSDEVRFGAEVPGSSSMVVAAGEPAVTAVVSSLVWNELEREASDWRSKDLFTASRDDIQRLAIDGEGGRILLVRRADGFWIESPVEDIADAERVSSLLGRLVGLRAERFLEREQRPLGALGLDPPQGALEVFVGAQAAPVRIELGLSSLDDTETHYLAIGGELVTVRTDFTADLARAAGDWQSHSLSRREAFETDRLVVRDAVGEMVLERQGAAWHRDGVEVDYSLVSDLVYAVAGAQVRPTEPGGGGLPAAASAYLTLELGGGGGIETVRLFAARDGETVATSEGRPWLLHLGTEAGQEIADRLRAVRAAEPTAEPSGGAASEAGEGADETPIG